MTAPAGSGPVVKAERPAVTGRSLMNKVAAPP
jgi:hypothetical protein